MGSNRAYYDPKFECLKDVARLVKARMKRGIEAEVACQALGQGEEARLFVVIKPYRFPNGVVENKEQLTHEPGIPSASLVPEKIGPIAYWMIKQMKAKRPELFIADDIIGW